MLIGTPGKLSDLSKKKILDLRDVRCLVLDEADVMLSEENQMGSQIHTVKQFLPEEPQVAATSHLLKELFMAGALL